MENFGISAKILKKGMTYIEVIVVLSIFSVVSSVVMYNYGDFQDRVEIKNLASDIALKIVEAQKSSLSGLLPPSTITVIPDWKPSYGVYFDINPASEKLHFAYFVDSNSNKFFDGTSCNGECLSKISITHGNQIEKLKVYYTDNTDALLEDATVTFSRPDSGAKLVSGLAGELSFSRFEITVVSPKGSEAIINVFPSGRVETL